MSQVASLKSVVLMRKSPNVNPKPVAVWRVDKLSPPRLLRSTRDETPEAIGLATGSDSPFCKDKTMSRNSPIAVFGFEPGCRLPVPLDAVPAYTVHLYKFGVSLLPDELRLYRFDKRYDPASLLSDFANVCDVFTRAWAEHSDPRGFMREMQRWGYVGRAFEYVLIDGSDNCWERSGLTLIPEPREPDKTRF